MGRRWRGKNKHWSRKNRGNGDTALEARRRSYITQYLNTYQEGAERAYWKARSQPQDTPILDETNQPTSNDSEADDCPFETHFPPLNEAVFDAPFLLLPSSLTSKERKLVHQCCDEMDLFHHSYNDTDANGNEVRCLVVSIYGDVFGPEILSAVSNSDQALRENEYVVAAYKFSPWYCRQYDGAGVNKDQGLSTCARREQVNKARRQIEGFIDHPENCLRDSIDVLDFDVLLNDDLSSIDPPMIHSQDDDCLLVDSADKMTECVRQLQNSNMTELAFDLEAYNVSKYTQLTCLLQLSSNNGKDYVIDTLADGVWDKVHELALFFSDPNIVKIGHSIGGLDVRCLHRDFGILVVNAFDTYEAATVLRLQGKGLDAVCEHYGIQRSDYYHELKEKYQKCNWRLRPLTEPMIQYGRYDVHFLVKLRQLMMRDLTRRELYDMSKAARDAEAQIVASSLLSLSFEDLEDNSIEDSTEYEANSNYEVSESKHEDKKDESGQILKDGNPSEDDQFFTPTSGRSLTGSNRESDNDITALNELNEEPETESEDQSTRFDATILRRQSDLMSVITTSQHRCNAIWTGRKEDPLQNGLFQLLTSKAKHGEMRWSEYQTSLYHQLVDWRSGLAQRLGCLDGFIVPLDFLVHVAWKMPHSILILKRICYVLPGVLEDYEEYQHEIIQIVNEARARHKKLSRISAAPVRLYSERTSAKNPPQDCKASPPRSADWFSAGVIATTVVVIVLVVQWRRRR